MSGVVGSSNNPVSGMTLATIITTVRQTFTLFDNIDEIMQSALMLAFMGKGTEGDPDYLLGPAASILIGAVVCCAAAVSGDNMQVSLIW